MSRDRRYHWTFRAAACGTSLRTCFPAISAGSLVFPAVCRNATGELKFFARRNRLSCRWLVRARTAECLRVLLRIVSDQDGFHR